MIDFNVLARRGRDSADGRCEYVEAGGGLALVRVAARGCALLAVPPGGPAQRFDAVPGPDRNGGASGFAVPLSVLRYDGMRLALLEPSGRERPLGTPVERPRAPSAQRELRELREAARDRDRVAAELRRHLDAESRARNALDRAAGERATLTRELRDVKRSLASVDRDCEQATRERDRAKAELVASRQHLAAANTRADAADRVARGRQLTIERLELKLEGQRRRGAFARALLHEAKRRAARLERAAETLERELEREQAAEADARTRIDQLERALSAQRAAAQMMREQLDRQDAVRPGVALRQLIVSVAGAGATPPLIDRFARRRR